MTKGEAKKICAQLGLAPMPPKDLFAYLTSKGLVVAVEHATADWIVLLGDDIVARVK